jgi:hypothetical protein
MASKAENIKEGIKLNQKINKLKEKTIALTAKEQKALDVLIDRQKVLNKEVRKGQQDRLDSFKSEESSIRSMGSMYSALTNSQTKSLKTISDSAALTDDKAKIDEAGIKTVLEMQRITRDIASLSKEEVNAKIALQNEYKTQSSILEGQEGITEEITKSLEKQYTAADSFSNMSAETKDTLQGQHTVLGGISKTMHIAYQTAKSLYGNLQGAIGGIITGLGMAVSKIGEANSELGTSMFQTDGVARKAGVLSLVFGDAVQSAKDLSSELGGTNKATFGLQANVGLMSTNMGISGTEASKLIGSFSRLNGNSTDVASDMVKTSQEFAKQNNIIPSQLMSDLANSTEEFALFGKDGGENILRAAGYAAKLGVSMSTMGGIAEGLLDMETSITKELELGAMLGKNINLNKARELAYNDDIEGAVKETMKQLGGIEAFNKMDYYQKKQTADLLGISVGELKKMNSNMENAGQLGSVLHSTFSKVGESVDAGLNKFLGVGLSTLGGWLTTSAQLGANFTQMGGSLGKLGKGIGNIGRGIGKGVGKIGRGIGKGVGKVAGGAGKIVVNTALLVYQKALNLAQSIGVGISNLATAASKRLAGSKLAELAMKIKDTVATYASNTAKFAGNVIDKGTLLLQKTWLGQKVLQLGAYVAEKVAIVAGTVAKWLGVGATVAASAANTALAGSNTAVGATGSVAAVGIAAVAAAALAGAAGLGVLALFAIAIGAALYLAAPALESFASIITAIGGVIVNVMSGIPPIIKAIAAGMVSILGAITLEKAVAVGLLAYSFLGLATSLGILAITSLMALPGLLGLSFVMGLLGIGFTIMGKGIQFVAQGFATLLPALSTFMSSITLGQVATIGLFALSLIGLAGSLGILGIASLFALPGLIGLSFVMGMLGAGLHLVGTGLQLIGGGMGMVVAAITQLIPLIGGIVSTIAPIALLSLAFMGLAGALMFLGTAGIFALPALLGIAAASAGVAVVASMFGFGGDSNESSETTSLEAGSLSEYEANMLAKMDQLIIATTSQRDIYLDKDKVTNTVMDRGERSSVNKFKLNRA